MASSPPPDLFHSSPQQQLGTPENKELPAPAGWLKKIASTTSGGTPRRGSVYFIAPDGKEIRSKRSLEGYLKSHPGGPSVTEFDWSTGDTPRRSSRLGSMTPVVSPESGAGNRRVRRKVAVEDEVPADDEKVSATSAKTEEVMEGVETLKESEAVEDDPMEKVESDSIKEVEKIIENPEEDKIGECAPEAKTEEPQTVESLSKVGMEGKEANTVLLKENVPEEELVNQEEFGGGKVQTEAEKLHSVMGETPVVVVSEEAKHGDEVTDNGIIGNFEEEHKQEGSEKPIIGFAQLSEAPEAPRPNGTSV